MEEIILNTSKFNFAILLGKVDRIINTKGKEKTLLSENEKKLIEYIIQIKPMGHNENVIQNKMRLCLSYIL